MAVGIDVGEGRGGHRDQTAAGRTVAVMSMKIAVVVAVEAARAARRGRAAGRGRRRRRCRPPRRPRPVSAAVGSGVAGPLTRRGPRLRGDVLEPDPGERLVRHGCRVRARPAVRTARSSPGCPRRRRRVPDGRDRGAGLRLAVGDQPHRDQHADQHDEQHQPDRPRSREWVRAGPHPTRSSHRRHALDPTRERGRQQADAQACQDQRLQASAGSTWTSHGLLPLMWHSLASHLASARRPQCGRRARSRPGQHLRIRSRSRPAAFEIVGWPDSTT